jgi:hypothetical protein
VDGKVNELQTDSKNNIRDLYRDTKEIKKGYEPRTNMLMVRQLMFLETPTIFGIGAGIVFLSS